MKDNIVELVSALGGLLITGLVLKIIPTADFFISLYEIKLTQNNKTATLICS